MIPIKLQIILLVISVIGLMIFVNMVKKHKLELRYALTWLLLLIILIVISIFPKFTLLISDLLSIETPVNTLFLFGILACFILIFSLTISLSRSSNKIKSLSQELGLLKQSIKILKEEGNYEKKRDEKK